MLNLYRFYWLDGTTSVWEGLTPQNALMNAGYGQGALAALDFYEVNEPEQKYTWDVENKTWKTIEGVTVSESKGLTGVDLLNALGLDKQYPTDSHFSDLTTQYGIVGILERLIGQYVYETYCVSKYRTDDEAKDMVEFHSQTTKILVEAIEKLKKMDIPKNIREDALCSDGRL